MFRLLNTNKIIPLSIDEQPSVSLSELPPPPPKSLPEEPSVEFYPITDKSYIADLKYNNNGLKDVRRDDDLFLYFHCPIGKLRDIVTTSTNNILSYKINGKRIILSDVFPTLSSETINMLPLYVGINQKMGGSNKKSRKNKRVNKKSRKSRK